jgi:hypothetical protein
MILDVETPPVKWQTVVSSDIVQNSSFLISDVHVSAVWRKCQTRRLIFILARLENGEETASTVTTVDTSVATALKSNPGGGATQNR